MTQMSSMDEIPYEDEYELRVGINGILAFWKAKFLGP